MLSWTHECMAQSDFKGILVKENSCSLDYILWTSEYKSGYIVYCMTLNICTIMK